MRPAFPAALLLLVLGTALPAEAEWLVLVGGKKIQTEGPWTLKGDLLTVHETTGRILTVGTNTVDAAACLKVNGGSLHIEAIATPRPPGSPVTRPEIAPAAAGSLPPGAPAAKPAKGKAPAKTAAASGQATSAAPATAVAPASSAAPAPAAATPTPGPAGAAAGADRIAAAKQAKQAQLQRELRHKQIVDGCATMFVVDRVGFQHCVDVQTKASPH